MTASDELRLAQERMARARELVDRYPHFANLTTGVLHQDWMHHFATWESAVEDWLGDFARDPVKRSRARTELEELSSQLPEEALGSIFDLLGSNVVPADDGLTHREWVREVLRRLDASRARPEGSDHTVGMGALGRQLYLLIHMAGGEPAAAPRARVLAALARHPLATAARTAADESLEFDLRFSDGGWLQLALAGADQRSDLTVQDCSLSQQSATFLQEIGVAGDYLLFDPQGKDTPVTPSVILFHEAQQGRLPTSTFSHQPVAANATLLADLLGMTPRLAQEYRTATLADIAAGRVQVITIAGAFVFVDLRELLLAHAARHPALRVMLLLTASWCEPCRELEALLMHPGLQRTLQGWLLLRVDIDRFGIGARSVGYQSSAVPTFVALDSQCRAVGAPLDGGAWTDSTDEAIAAALVPWLRDCATRRE
ncbi:contact-dependent growth inhibition system immunity protein [Piscinibacter sp.]|uniref:contact-dependent growth inhibition system immunity protein n=1 Tax=Piscinibacter sp. TaxID=1903157 RepID=UPI001DA3FA19|nr:contact-dependent growth inhibition system immunity protein [Piscinibacter sp.]MBK7529738.1 hypothetical protein [Piscinibacter sp.]